MPCLVPQTEAVIAILGGLGAAVLWAAANLASSRSSRLIGASSTVAWMMVVGLVVATPFAVASGPLPTITPTLALWLTASGVGGVVGLMLVYRGLRIGKVGVVLALASTEGAIAAVLAVVAGESLTIPTALVLGVIAIGVATVALAGGGAVEPTEVVEEETTGPLARLGTERRAALFGAAAAGVGSPRRYCIGRVYPVHQVRLVIVALVHDHAEFEFLDVRQAACLAGLLTGPREDGEEYRRQNGDDGDDDQQLDQRKALALHAWCPFW